MKKMMERLGLLSATLSTGGPFPLKYVFGMKITVTVLDRSLDPELYEQKDAIGRY
jgi:hypothetical protein